MTDKDPIREHFEEHPLTKEHLDEHIETIKERMGSKSRRYISDKFKDIASGVNDSFESQPGQAQIAPPDDLSEATPDRRFTIHAVNVDIVYNRFGLHQPTGAMYVLEENRDAVLEASGDIPSDAFALIEDPDDNDPGVDTSVIEPLTIRANQGDLIEIEFVNELDRRASIHQAALPYNVETSDGMAVGTNPDTTVAPGETGTYRWFASHNGPKFFYDGANQAFATAADPPQQANLLARGLFGTLVVENPGATWHDPGDLSQELPSGTRAVIDDPVLGTVYREFAIYYHDGEGTQTQEGGEVFYPGTDTVQPIHSINYRADPTGQRVDPESELDVREQKEFFYNSWTNGDPGGGDLVFPTYKGDPVKFIFASASVEENHVHHLHNHRWKELPRTAADTLDAQSTGLGDTYEAFLVVAHGPNSTRPGLSFEDAFEVGAGYAHKNIGDVLFHCHLFPHYGEGMWALMRIHNKEQPDLALLPTTDDDVLPADSDIPGFPEFIPTEKGNPPPKPPLSEVENPRLPTPEEEAVFGDDIIPGAPYSDPCVDANRILRYNLVALPADVVYNDAGEHDPAGKVYVLDEYEIEDADTGDIIDSGTTGDAAAVREGRMNPEPLFIRANVGDCIEFTVENELDIPTSIHTHFVAFDVLGSDSLGTGYNYDQKTNTDGAMHYRWFCDESGGIFFHDHILGIEEAMHGLFAALLIEPTGSEWLDPYTGEPVYSGAQAVISPPDQNDFRELALHYQDFAQLVNQSGDFIVEGEQHDENAGTMAINMRNAPYYLRHDPDPAYVHSSRIHGDPATPVVEGYPDDPIKVRLFQGVWEEQHNFQFHSLRINPEGFAPEDTVSQVIGTAETFNFNVEQEADDVFEPLNNPDGIPVRDYLYGSDMINDRWGGMWGITRIWGTEVNHLQPLPDQGPPDESLANCEKVLRGMGHPAVFDNREEEGQRALRLYDADDDRSLPSDIDSRQNPNVGPDNVPPVSPFPGEPAPADTPVKHFDVTALQTDIRYNDYGDHDPHGIVFALDTHVEEIRSGARNPEPVDLHVNRGELIEVTLTNELPETLDDDHPHPEMRVTHPWERGNRISLHPSRLLYDVNGSDGSAVGFNFDTTVGPGESITYRWYADEDLGGSVLKDLGDFRGNEHHGAFGYVFVEPPESVVLDARTAEPALSTNQVMVKTPADQRDYRDLALVFADGQYIINPDGECVIPAGADPTDDEIDPSEPCNQLGDPEDQGFSSINYRSEPFARRLNDNPSEYLVYSSDVHGDPNTPILYGFAGDPTTFRVSQAADRSRGLSFHLASHQWQRFRGVDESPIGGVDSQLSPGKTERYDLMGGAGGLVGSTGDFIYQETKQRRRLESGMWGIFRVLPPLSAGGTTASVASPDGGFEFEKLDSPDPEVLDPTFQQEAPPVDPPIQPLPDRAGGIPLEERPGYTVTTGDSTGAGTQDVLVGVPASDIGGIEAGAAYLFTDTTPDEITDLAIADLQLLGTEPGMRAGQNVSIGGPGAAGGGDLVIDTDAGVETVPGGEIQGLIESPPETELGNTVQQTTNAPINATVPLDVASRDGET